MERKALSRREAGRWCRARVGEGREGEGPRFGIRCLSGKWFQVEWGQNPDFRGSTEINGVWAAVSKSDDEKTDGVALCTGSGAAGSVLWDREAHSGL